MGLVNAARERGVGAADEAHRGGGVQRAPEDAGGEVGVQHPDQAREVLDGANGHPCEERSDRPPPRRPMIRASDMIIPITRRRGQPIAASTPNSRIRSTNVIVIALMTTIAPMTTASTVLPRSAAWMRARLLSAATELRNGADGHQRREVVVDAGLDGRDVRRAGVACTKSRVSWSGWRW